MSSPDAVDPAPPRAIVIGHGDFAAGMQSAVQKITGRGSALIALSAEECGSCSLVQLVDLLRKRIQESGVSVIFTDLQAGSATMAARKLLHNMPDTVLVVGANLAVMLDFVLNTEATPVDAARHAAERGRLAIQVQEGGA